MWTDGGVHLESTLLGVSPGSMNICVLNSEWVLVSERHGNEFKSTK